MSVMCPSYKSHISEYFKEELKWEMSTLGCMNPSMFYLSIWQTSKSPIPMLMVRLAMLITSVSIVIASMVAFAEHYGLWYIYLTHWGLAVITLANGFGVAVSLRCHFFGPLKMHTPLPWYVKVYWVLYNIGVPSAFLISILYWMVLSEDGIEGVDTSLDVTMHSLNSVIMFVLFFASSHPTRLLHMYQPALFAVAYAIFGYAYYRGGGTGPLGDPWVYPIVNWSQPAMTSLFVVLPGLWLLIIHFYTALLSAVRDRIAAYFVGIRVVKVDEGWHSLVSIV